MIMILVFQDGNAIRETCCENLANARARLDQYRKEGMRFLGVHSKTIWW